MPSGGESAFCTRSAKRRQKDAAGRLTFLPSCATIYILCRCGGTGRRKGLKIPRIVRFVPVRFRSSAPKTTVVKFRSSFLLLISKMDLSVSYF